MAFKRDWSFLDKITMGSVGTKRVIEILNAEGHQIIELERYCTSNKIWSTKIKRLRIPDLLCLRCGKRIESRAKSKLGIIMSDSKNNLDRRWYSGLRKSDLVAFVQCHRNVEGLWEASRTINLFSVGDMLSKESLTKLSAPKSVYEGAERDREWKCYIPGYDFKVVAIEKGKDGTRIKFMTPTGKRHSRVIASDHYVYVNEGDNFLGKEKIVSGIVPSTYDCHCTGEQYDFIKDLKSEENETKYTAIKSVNILLTSGFSTNHHTNHDIIAKYRKVPWTFSIYEGIVLKEIYVMRPEQLEPIFRHWEDQLDDGRSHINNPKIPVKFVRENGLKVYPINPQHPIDPDLINI